MNHRKSRMGTNRDFGTEGAGKGDSDRTTNRAAYSENLAEIPLGGHVEGFRKVGLKQVKVYGKSSEPLWRAIPPAVSGQVFAETDGERVDHVLSATPITTDIVRE